jgi:hypothetical protein
MNTIQEKFSLSFDENENKIYVHYNGNEPVNYKVSIKDMTSKCPMYWFNFQATNSVTWYVIPIPTHIIKFKRLSSFRGFDVDFYNEDIERLIINELKKYKNVLVLGVEKMTDVEVSIATQALSSAADEEWESYYGITFPSLYSMIARDHMRRFGTTKTDLARISVKNHTLDIGRFYSIEIYDCNEYDLFGNLPG